MFLKLPKTLFVVALFICAGPLLAQQQSYDWLPANDETVKLDPADYHTGRVYRPGEQGGNLHVDIEAQQPVTVAMTWAEEWNHALDHRDEMANIRFRCVREHVVKTTYVCDSLPERPMVLIVQDERNADPAVFTGPGTIFSGYGGRALQFVSPNDVHIQYYRWACVENCFPPQFQWVRQVKEKYELTSILKIYGGLIPERDGEQVSVKIKAPVPMAVAILPSAVADRLHEKPETLESSLAGSHCKQRGMQSLSFECTLHVADGPQSVVILPEPGTAVSGHKNAAIEVISQKCVANCAATTDR